MNFGQIATAAGQRLGVDTSSPSTRNGSAVRSSIASRHDQLYRSFLWKDSVIEFDISLSNAYTPTSNYMPTKGHVILPPIFQHVLGARLGCRALNIERPMLYYRANFSEFFNSGYAAQFMLLSSCVWEFDTVQTLGLNTANAGDNAQIATLDILAADEVTVNRIMQQTVYPASPSFTTDRIDNFIKPTTGGTVGIGVFTGTTIGPNLIPFPASSAASQYQIANLLAAASTYQITWGHNETQFSYGIFPNLTTIANPGFGQVTTFTYPAGSNFAAFDYSQPIALVTAKVSLVAPVYQSFVTLNPNDQSAPKSPRFQLVGNPTNTTQATQNLFVLGKRNTPPFAVETDVPGINGLDGILIALAYYDFKQRDESGGTPDALAALNEAVGPQFLAGGKPGGFLGKLIEEEVIQAAYNCRIVPSHGFGGENYYDEPYGTKSEPYWGAW